MFWKRLMFVKKLMYQSSYKSDNTRDNKSYCLTDMGTIDMNSDRDPELFQRQ